MDTLEARFAAGAAALDAQDLAGAERIFRALVQAEPRLHAAWNALSVVSARAGKPELALAHARKALELDRRNPLYLNNLGVAHGELGQFEEAEAAFRRALKIKAVYPEGLFNLGKVLHKQARLADALRAYERTYAMRREFPGLRLALAAMYRLTGNAARALEVMREFRELDDYSAAYHADMLAEAEGVEAALAWMRTTLAERPEWRLLHYHLASVLLSIADWREGWREFSFRPTLPAQAREGHHAGLSSASLEGAKVLLRSEQGLGDVLFFLRFARFLEERGAQIVLECPPKLAPVLEGRFPPSADAVDIKLWLGDLPMVLGATDTPPPLPLAANKEEGLRILSQLGPAPYMALTWRAGTDILRQREFGSFRHSLAKEIDLGQLGSALRSCPGTLVALQRNPASGELAAIAQAAGAPVHDLSALNEDLARMLDVLAALDEYVTVSNTNVHLIAGLGGKARVLVPFPAEWRWMREGDQSPWFPGFSVYRQSAARDWSDALARLRADFSLG